MSLAAQDQDITIGNAKFKVKDDYSKAWWLIRPVNANDLALALLLCGRVTGDADVYICPHRPALKLDSATPVVPANKDAERLLGQAMDWALRQVIAGLLSDSPGQGTRFIGLAEMTRHLASSYEKVRGVLDRELLNELDHAIRYAKNRAALRDRWLFRQHDVALVYSEELDDGVYAIYAIWRSWPGETALYPEHLPAVNMDIEIYEVRYPSLKLLEGDLLKAPYSEQRPLPGSKHLATVTVDFIPSDAITVYDVATDLPKNDERLQLIKGWLSGFLFSLFGAPIEEPAAEGSN